jgi:hypothetical protein
MSFPDLAAIGSLISGIAVLASLVFLYFQLRQLNAQLSQAERFQQTLVKQARTSRVMEVAARLTDESFAALHLRVMTNADDLSLLDRSRYFGHAKAVFQNGEDTYSQYRRGLLHEDDFNGFVRALEQSFQSPGLRVAWYADRWSFPEPYAAFIDKIVASVPVTPMASDTLVKWRAALAAEIGKAQPAE